MNDLTRCMEAHLKRLAETSSIRRTPNDSKFHLRRFLRWLDQAGITEPRQLTAVHIQRWRESMFQRRLPSGSAIKAQTMVGYQGCIKAYCREMVRRGRCSSDVLDGFAPIKCPSPLPQPTPNHQEMRQLLSSMRTGTPLEWMIRTIAEILYSTGIRPSELLALNLADLSRDAGMIKVVGKGKERMVPVGKTATRFLDVYLQGVRPLFLRDPANNAVWLGPLGHRLTYRRLRAYFKPVWPKRPERRVTCYTFRRACATELVRAGVSLWAVKELLGHENLNKLKHYVQLTIVDLQRAHERCHPRDRMNHCET